MTPPIFIESYFLHFSAVASSFEKDKWNTLRNLTQSLFKVFSVKAVTETLYYGIVAAVKLDDKDFFETMLSYLPSSIDDDLLAYNFACGYAQFSNKQAMLLVIERSCELGKLPEDFIRDKDFSNYHEDSDLLELTHQEKQRYYSLDDDCDYYDDSGYLKDYPKLPERVSLNLGPSITEILPEPLRFKMDPEWGETRC